MDGLNQSVWADEGDMFDQWRASPTSRKFLRGVWFDVSMYQISAGLHLLHLPGLLGPHAASHLRYQNQRTLPTLMSFSHKPDC